jgi:hypothetical protein
MSTNAVIKILYLGQPYRTPSFQKIKMLEWFSLLQLDQYFSIGGTRTTSGMLMVPWWYAKKFGGFFYNKDLETSITLIKSF